VKKLSLMMAALLTGCIVLAQTNDYSNRSVRDPIQLEGKINADMSATDTRLDALEASTNANSGVFKAAYVGALTVGTNQTVGGTLTVNGATALNGLATTGTVSLTGGATVTNTFFTVAAGTANCLTNRVISVGGVVKTGTTGQ